MRTLALIAAGLATAAPQQLPRPTERHVAAVECRLTADEAWQALDGFGYHSNDLDRTARTGTGDVRTRGVRAFGLAATAIRMRYADDGGAGARPHFTITTTVAARNRPARDAVLGRLRHACDATIPLPGGVSACRIDLASPNPGHPVSLTIAPTSLRTDLICAYRP